MSMNAMKPYQTLWEDRIHKISYNSKESFLLPTKCYTYVKL